MIEDKSVQSQSNKNFSQIDPNEPHYGDKSISLDQELMTQQLKEKL